MRSDMKKVITERPRAGGGIKTPRGDKRDWQRYEIDEMPKREKIRVKWQRRWNGKEFTDLLGPLYRYLLNQVGRKWDAVYSEIARNLPKTNIPNIHVYTHLWQFVEKDVVLIDGVACYKDGRQYGMPIRSRGRYHQLYINPVTGLLCKAKKIKPQRNSSGRYGCQPGIKVYPGVQYHKVNGVWYEVMVRKLPAPNSMNPWGTSYSLKDEVLGRHYENLGQLESVYGGRYLAESKRPLNKREIKFAGLK